MRRTLKRLYNWHRCGLIPRKFHRLQPFLYLRHGINRINKHARPRGILAASWREVAAIHRSTTKVNIGHVAPVGECVVRVQGSMPSIHYGNIPSLGRFMVGIERSVSPEHPRHDEPVGRFMDRVERPMSPKYSEDDEPVSRLLVGVKGSMSPIYPGDDSPIDNAISAICGADAAKAAPGSFDGQKYRDRRITRANTTPAAVAHAAVYGV